LARRDAGSADAARRDAGHAPDAGPPPLGTIPVIVATGQAWRSIISYDDGLTWSHDQAIDDMGTDCDAIDCTHHPGHSLGLAYAEGWFFAEFGNVSLGDVHPTVRRSRDAVEWEILREGFAGGLAYGNGRLVLGTNPPVYSDDLGETWREGEYTDPRPGAQNLRDTFFFPHDGGRFIHRWASGAAIDVMISADGVRFESASELPIECDMQTIVYGSGVLVGTSIGGFACRSVDGGDHWTSVALPGVTSATVWTGEAFHTYGSDTLYTSADGVAWDALATDSDLRHFTVRSLEGTLIGYRGWNDRSFSRSEDGVSWARIGSDVERPWIGRIVPGYAPFVR
jgi:hypothetical protein